MEQLVHTDCRSIPNDVYTTRVQHHSLLISFKTAKVSLIFAVYSCSFVAFTVLDNSQPAVTPTAATTPFTNKRSGTLRRNLFAAAPTRRNTTSFATILCRTRRLRKHF